MTREGWRDAAIEAVTEYFKGDASRLDLLAQLLEEQDSAKNRLREIGYGCIGMPWLKVVEEIEYVVDCLP